MGKRQPKLIDRMTISALQEVCWKTTKDLRSGKISPEKAYVIAYSLGQITKAARLQLHAAEYSGNQLPKHALDLYQFDMKKISKF